MFLRRSIFLPPFTWKVHKEKYKVFSDTHDLMTFFPSGVLFDATGSFVALYLLMGSCMLTGALLVVLVPLIYRYQLNRGPYTITPAST